MNEKEKRTARTVHAVSKNLECFPISHDPSRQFQVSGLQLETPVERDDECPLMDAMEKIGIVVGSIACSGMIYLLIRMSYGVLWV